MKNIITQYVSTFFEKDAIIDVTVNARTHTYTATVAEPKNDDFEFCFVEGSYDGLNVTTECVY